MTFMAFFIVQSKAKFTVRCFVVLAEDHDSVFNDDHDEANQKPERQQASLRRMINSEPSAIQPSSDSDPNHDDEGEVETPPGCLFRIRMGPRGRGLFATEQIPPLTVIHIAPCVLVSKDEYDTHMRFTILEHYLFNDYLSSGGDKLLALGYGSLFNHDSRQPNVNYRVNSNKKKNSNNAAATITYMSGPKPIRKGDELCISYGSKLWFEDADGQGSESSESNSEEPVDFLGRINLLEDEGER